MSQIKEKNYFKHRIIDTLGFNEAYYTLKLSVNDAFDLPHSSTQDFPILQQDNKGNILMYPFTLSGNLICYDKDTRKRQSAPAIYHLTRYNGFKELPKDSEGKEIKSRMPTGQGTNPLIPPNLYRAWIKWKKAKTEKTKRKYEIETLYFTEGYLKALKGDFHDLPIVGLSSISHYQDRDQNQKKEPYNDILTIISDLKVKNIVLLHDADATVVNKYLDPKNHLDFESAEMTKRPNSFVASVQGFYNVYAEHVENIYYAHIHEKFNKTAKGLDDLIVLKQQKGEGAKVVIDDLINYEDGCKFFWFLKLDHNRRRKLLEHFNLTSERAFYRAYFDVIGERQFVFKGSVYKGIDDGEKQSVELVYDALLSRVKYIDNDVFEIRKEPKNLGTDENGKQILNYVTTLNKISVVTCKLTYGKDSIEKIISNRFHSFVNIPGHGPEYVKFIQYHDYSGNYQYYNLYNPLTKKPKPFDFPTDNYDIPELEYSLGMVKQIFGECNEKGKIGDLFELGMDYLTILWQKPTSKLPILCLLSEERGTGKTVFMDWMSIIFESNAQKIKSEDITNQFNSDWIGNLLVMIDEALFEKSIAVEKLKNYSTGYDAAIEVKGGAKSVVDCHIKVIMNSNKTRSFLKVDKNEDRFWMLEIPSIKNKIVNIREKLKNEVEHFIYYLSQRKIVHPRVDRMWFKKDLYRTEALKRLIVATDNWTIQAIKDTLSHLWESQLTNPLSCVKDTIYISPKELKMLVKKYDGDNNLTVKQIKHHLTIDGIESVNSTSPTKLKFESKTSDFDSDLCAKFEPNTSNGWRHYRIPLSYFLSERQLRQFESDKQNQVKDDLPF